MDRGDLNLHLRRRWFDEKTTIGELYWNESTLRDCFTLEDKVREDGVKVVGETAIPAGKYELCISYSGRYGKLMPRLLNVENFSGILIHPGNTQKDTAGCVLVGRHVINRQALAESVSAFEKLFDKLLEASRVQKMFIDITNEPYMGTISPEHVA